MQFTDDATMLSELVLNVYESVLFYSKFHSCRQMSQINPVISLYVGSNTSRDAFTGEEVGVAVP